MEDGIEKLLDLSPFDLKHLLLLIFSSKEFTVDESKIAVRVVLIEEHLSYNLPCSGKFSLVQIFTKMGNLA